MSDDTPDINDFSKQHGVDATRQKIDEAVIHGSDCDRISKIAQEEAAKRKAAREEAARERAAQKKAARESRKAKPESPEGSAKPPDAGQGHDRGTQGSANGGAE